MDVTEQKKQWYLQYTSDLYTLIIYTLQYIYYMYLKV